MGEVGNGKGNAQSLIFESLICSRTSGQTAAWHFLYSSIHSGFRYSHWPILLGPWLFGVDVIVCGGRECGFGTEGRIVFWALVLGNLENV
jgi:hypothetical protein